jgi:hypothetical protein
MGPGTHFQHEETSDSAVRSSEEPTAAEGDGVGRVIEYDTASRAAVEDPDGDLNEEEKRGAEARENHLLAGTEETAPSHAYAFWRKERYRI